MVFRILAVLAATFTTGVASAQHAPSIGYMFPPGGRAGETVDVVLGGYDWTPDVQLFAYPAGAKLEMLAPPGPVIVPEPPYWFGSKARRPPFPLPRETQARLTLSADLEPGVYHWQIANANGASATGRFAVSNDPEVVEIEKRAAPQELAALPVTVSGRIRKIEEVDVYTFTVTASGPVTCRIAAKSLGSPLNAYIEVADDSGRPTAAAADTAGRDAALTFNARAGVRYTAKVFDVDFRGNRAFVYRLSITRGPRVIAAIPAAGKRGETGDVEFVGWGVQSGDADRLESVVRKVAFPADANAESVAYRLETEHGAAPPIRLQLSDVADAVEATNAAAPLVPGVGITGVLEERNGEDRFRCKGAKGDAWRIDAASARFEAPLDLFLAVYGADGKELASNDDLRPDTTDAGLTFSLPADGEYVVGVSDASSHGGNRAAVYRLAVRNPIRKFTLEPPEFVNLPIGGKANLALKVVRSSEFKDAIAVSLAGLPAGVAVPAELTVPAGQSALTIPLTATADAAAVAAPVTITGVSKPPKQPADAAKPAPAATPVPPVIQSTTGPVLVATTITPPFALDAEGKDDVTKWPRGSTFPAPVLIERNPGFTGEIMLEMTSKQGRHRQGIRGPELAVAPDVKRILYPVTLPEWLETTRTSRMVVNGVAKVADPKGNVRYSVSRQKTRMGFLPTGALLKITSTVKEVETTAGGSFTVPISISRSAKLTGPLRLELQSPGGTQVESRELFRARKAEFNAADVGAKFTIHAAADVAPGVHQLTIRATVVDDAGLPVVSEANMEVVVATPAGVAQ